MNTRTATQPGDASGSGVRVSIEARYAYCERSFYKLLQALQGLKDQTFSQRLLDEFGRFRVWAGDVGADKIGRVSLDYHLREASHIHAELIGHLEELNKDLEEGGFPFHCPQ